MNMACATVLEFKSIQIYKTFKNDVVNNLQNRRLKSNCWPTRRTVLLLNHQSISTLQTVVQLTANPSHSLVERLFVVSQRNCSTPSIIQAKHSVDAQVKRQVRIGGWISRSITMAVLDVGWTGFETRNPSLPMSIGPVMMTSRRGTIGLFLNFYVFMIFIQSRMFYLYQFCHDYILEYSFYVTSVTTVPPM